MNGYIAHFLVYSMAMTGFIVLALYIYKKSMAYTRNSGSREFLKIENAMRLTPGKTLYVIKAGSERFLIAGDAQNTTMLAKLDENNFIPEGTSQIKEGMKQSVVSTEMIKKIYGG